MTRHPVCLPAPTHSAFVARLAEAWTLHIAELDRCINAQRLPSHHRLGAWQLMIFPAPVTQVENEPEAKSAASAVGLNPEPES